MATFITRDQLVDRAAHELGAVGTGQSIEAEDQERIDGRVDGLFGELSARGVCYIGDDQEIPIELSGPLAELLANEVAPSYGRQKMDDASRVAIENRIRVILASGPTYAPLAVDYF